MIDYIKSLKWIDYYFFTIIDPRRLFNLISREEGSPILLGLITVAFVSIIEILSFSLIGNETQFFYYKITYGWILSFLLYILSIIIFASLVDLFCQFRGHSGSIKPIINLITISLFSRSLLLPIFFIFKVLNFAPIFFYILFSLALFIWHALIIIQGLSEMHQMEFAESLVSFLFPLIFVGIIFFFSSILLIINFVGFVSFI